MEPGAEPLIDTEMSVSTLRPRRDTRHHIRGFYVNPRYLKYTRTQAKLKAPRRGGQRKNMANYVGGTYLLLRL